MNAHMMQHNVAHLGKWWQTIQMFMVQAAAYKLNFFLLVLGPSLVFFFVKYNLWVSVYAIEGVTEIRGYTLHKMLSYQFWVLITVFLSQSYASIKLAEDIRLGRISAFLLYPFGFFQFHAAGFLGFQLIQLGISLITCLVPWWWGILLFPQGVDLMMGFGVCFFASLFWFFCNFLFGIFAFWLEKTWMLRALFITIASFFSGGVLPIEFFPAWLQKGLVWSPFPYITYEPVRIFLGESDRALQAVGMLLIWTAIVCLICRFVWNRGVKNYTGAGI